jgi:tetratricopeptide (TPR) repeat protein
METSQMKYRLCLLFTLLSVPLCLAQSNETSSLILQTLPGLPYQQIQHLDSLFHHHKDIQVVAVLDSMQDARPTAEVALLLGRQYAKQKQWSQAENAFLEAKKRRSGYAQAYFELGQLYMEGPFLLEDAYMQFRWCIAHDPTFWDAYYYKARIRMINRKLTAGLGELEPLLLKNPGYKKA